MKYVMKHYFPFQSFPVRSFVGGILIVPVPGHCLPFTFSFQSTQTSSLRLLHELCGMVTYATGRFKPVFLKKHCSVICIAFRICL